MDMIGPNLGSLGQDFLHTTVPICGFCDCVYMLVHVRVIIIQIPNRIYSIECLLENLENLIFFINSVLHSNN